MFANDETQLVHQPLEKRHLAIVQIFEQFDSFEVGDDRIIKFSGTLNVHEPTQKYLLGDKRKSRSVVIHRRVINNDFFKNFGNAWIAIAQCPAQVPFGFVREFRIGIHCFNIVFDDFGVQNRHRFVSWL